MTLADILAQAETFHGDTGVLSDVYRDMYDLGLMPSEADDVLKALHKTTKKTLRMLREDWSVFCQVRDQLVQSANARHRNGNTPSTPEHEPPLPLSDYTNALAFVHDHGTDVRYCEAWKKWLIWTGTHWSYKVQAPVLQKAKQTIKALLRHAAQLTDDEYRAWLAHIKRSLSTAALKAMVESAQNEPGIPLEHEQMNRHPWLLSCLNGTLDLKTGTLRPHARDDFLTDCLALAYDESATCPRWEAFLWKILGGTNPEDDTDDMGSGLLEERSAADARATLLRDYLQRVFGSCLTGDVSEQDLYVF